VYNILQGTLSAGGNYTINFVGADFTITPREITVTADAKGKVFGAADPALTYTSSDPEASFTGALSREAGENVGVYNILQGTLSAGGNYTINFVGADFTITPASATVTLSNLNQIYDGTPRQVTVTTVPAGLAVAVTYDGSATPPTDAGSYAVLATVTDPNYVGTASGTLVISAAHNVHLEPGWNLVSFSLHPFNTNIANVLSSIAGNYDLVYAWDASGAHAGSGNWLKFDNEPASPDSLTILDETMGFWIHMTAADTLEITGSVPETTDIELMTAAGGWNLVGYASAVGRSLPSALQDHGVGSDFSLVYAYHVGETADPWKLFDPTVPPMLNDLTELTPGWGYWIHVSANHTWSVDYLAP
jgi:hypothetical protein